MSDASERSDPTPSGIDRRSALKKAAVGGAIAWTVPTVLSSKVSATEVDAGGCTLKCFGSGNPTPDSFQNFIACSTSGAKWVGVRAGIDATCPCSDNANQVASVQFAGLRVTGGAGTQDLVVDSQSINNAVSPPTVQAVFRTNGGGAVGAGTVQGTVTFVIQCQDRTGDILLTQCSGTFSFTWSPANGNCGDVINLGNANYVQTGCVIIPCT